MSPDKPRGFRGIFRTDDDARAVYAEAAGIARILPRAVAVPADADDVSALVRWARARGQAIVPRGSGSSMAGGAVGDGIILDLSRMRGIGAPGREERMVRVEAGALRGETDRRAASVGLQFPVDPSSGEFCTVGGMAATNAAGPHSLRHGSIRPWVLGVECVFDDGSIATLRRGTPPPTDVPAIRRFMSDAHATLLTHGARPELEHPGVIKDSSGYAVRRYAETSELIDLLVGSEGTLAIFTAIDLALVPAVAATASVLVSFRDIGGAVEAAIRCRELGASACELFDRTFLGIAAQGGAALPVSPDSDAALLIETEGDDAAAAHALAERIAADCRSFGVLDSTVASEPARATELWSLRHAASPAIARMDSRLRSMQFIEDAAVPPARLADYVRGVRAILDRAGVAGVIFGHAGDAHVHVNPLLNVGEPDWRPTLERILLEVTDLVAGLNGSHTGEHGDGRLRTPLLDRVWHARALEAFALVKRSLDPDAIFNPGVKVALPNQRAVDVVKYDPALDALPTRARAALDTVERERGYARFRLDLL